MDDHGAAHQRRHRRFNHGGLGDLRAVPGEGRAAITSVLRRAAEAIIDLDSVSLVRQVLRS